MPTIEDKLKANSNKCCDTLILSKIINRTKYERKNKIKEEYYYYYYGLTMMGDKNKNKITGFYRVI